MLLYIYKNVLIPIFNYKITFFKSPHAHKNFNLVILNKKNHFYTLVYIKISDVRTCLRFGIKKKYIMQNFPPQHTKFRT